MKSVHNLMPQGRLTSTLSVEMANSGWKISSTLPGLGITQQKQMEF